MSGLQGRALDEAVARAMGYGTRKLREGLWLLADSMGVAIPAYSTDAATLAEMLDWLTDFGTLRISANIYRHPDVFEIDLNPFDGVEVDVGHSERGETLNEAVARLVVAVAAAKVVK